MQKHVLAIDIGGTKLAASIVDSSGAMSATGRVATPSGPGVGGAEVFAALAGMIGDVVGADGGGTVGAEGIGSAGPVDVGAGTVSPVNIAGWRGFPLVEEVGRLMPGIRVELAGDGICAALGESWLGAGRDVRTQVTIVGSTGVGGGLVVDGKPFLGRTGKAGHVGHVIVDFAGDPCACGSRGCVEAYSSGPSMTRWAVAEGWRPEDGQQASGVSLAASARDGDAIALRAFERGARALAAGITSTAAVADLDLVVLGGGISAAGDVIFAPLRSALAEYAHLEFLAGIRVVPAKLGGEAGLIGAAALALRAAG